MCARTIAPEKGRFWASTTATSAYTCLACPLRLSTQWRMICRGHMSGVGVGTGVLVRVGVGLAIGVGHVPPSPDRVPGMVAPAVNWLGTFLIMPNKKSWRYVTFTLIASGLDV